MLLLKGSKIVWSKRSRYFLGTIQHILVFILFLCYITVTCRHTIVFTANIASQTSKLHLSACNIWTFSRRFSRNLTPRASKKYFNSTGSCVLFFYRQHHTFDVKTCFQQNRYAFDVIVTSWALFVFCISWNFPRDISLSAWNIWTFFRRFSRNLTPRAPKKYLDSICVLFILIIL
jgi:uncharacterized membrane protein